MPTDTRTTMRVAAPVLQSSSNNSLGWDGPWTLGSAYSVSASYTDKYRPGLFKTITSVRTSRSEPFIPGKFRVNPCTIETCICASQPIDLRVYIPRKYTLSTFRRIYGDPVVSTCYWWNQMIQPPSSILADVALQKAYVNSAEADFDAGQSLVELKETVEMLRRPLAGVTKFLAKPRNFKKIRQYPNMIASTWLEYRYGIRPLLRDIENLIRHLRAVTTDFNAEMRRTGGHAIWEADRSWNLETAPTPDNMCLFSHKYIHRCHLRTSSKLYFKMAEPLSWQQRYGVDMFSIPSLVWEKVPLSFVVDWTFNIGLWLNAHRVVPQRTILGSCTSVKRIDSVDVLPYNLRCAPNYEATARIYSVGSMRWSREQLVRSINGSLPALPSVTPGFESVLHGLDSLTLAMQRIDFTKLRR